MRLADESHREVEEFFRRHTGTPWLVLPPVYVYAGGFAKLLTKMSGGVAAITFGPMVFVRPSLVRKDSAGRAGLPAWLLVHEAAHVLQYEERGTLRFLVGYLRGYFRVLWDGKKFDAAARNRAYLAIPEECAAREAERAYLESRSGAA
ncbi:MAG TPA: hypothetical protein VM914_05605 [Pyrinomonadaceae bacterium]|jgi:hypothetical protein|nr:hypothetical protein [Pyrinomonadaceae bacterium]